MANSKDFQHTAKQDLAITSPPYMNGLDGYPGPYNKGKCGLELCDLKNDISETKDVAVRHPEIVKKLKVLAEKAREDLGDRLTNRNGKNVRPPGKLSEDL